MNASRNIVIMTVILIMGLWAFREWQIHANSSASGTIGPDVIVGDIPSIRYWGNVGDTVAFSIGTTSCNIGDERLDWIANSNIHPVISQNLYRVKDGRIEQIGMSWLKHGFAVAAGSYCDQCQDPSSNYLGVGCSDPYSAGLNGSQSRLGPRSEVNATTGYFDWPHRNLPQQGTLDGRIRVPNDELDPAMNSGARYFVESQYVHPQDASSGNDDNNASYREAFVSSLGGGNFDLNTGGPPTVREQPAINAWQALYPEVEFFVVDIPGDGRVIVGILTTELPGNGFHTEVAVENLNSHRSVQSVGLKFGSGTVTNPGFNDVDYQFEPYASTDWAPAINANEVEWATESFATNQDANAIRWNTLYSYWCDSDTPPVEMTLGIFRPGTPTEITIDLSNTELVNVDSVNVVVGSQHSGQLSDVDDSDDNYLCFVRGAAFSPIFPSIWLEFEGTLPSDSPSELKVTLEAQVNDFGIDQGIEMYNFSTGQFETVDTRDASRNSDSVVEVQLTGDVTRFVEAGTGKVRTKVTYIDDGSGFIFGWRACIDQFIWSVTP